MCYAFIDAKQFEPAASKKFLTKIYFVVDFCIGENVVDESKELLFGRVLDWKMNWTRSTGVF